MDSLTALLELQEHDTGSDQLIYRRAHLAEREQIVQAETAIAQLETESAPERAAQHEIQLEQRRLEDEIALLSEKIESVTKHLYGDNITSPKEAQALQADIESLQRHKNELEENVLDCMERIEPLDSQLADVAQQIEALQKQRDEAAQSLVKAETEIDNELATRNEKRQSLLAPVPSELLSEYERRRSSLGGVVVAQLKGSVCAGCHLSLAPAEVDKIRKESAASLAECPDCGRILIP